MSARDEILGHLRQSLGRADLPFPPSAPEPLTADTRLTVTTVGGVEEGDASALAARFGHELETLHGSYEIAANAVMARMALISRIQEWMAEEEANRKGKTLETGQEQCILGWQPEQLPLEGLGPMLADLDLQLVTPHDLHDEAERASVRHIRYGVTGVEAAFASTGSMLLASSTPGSSRAASLLPFRHVALIPFSRLYPTVEAWLAEWRARGKLLDLLSQHANMTLVTGPSKSADIEGNLTLGVHGPKFVHAILFDDATE